MRVLVTGATGFLGRAVVKEMARRGHEPVALVRKPDSRVDSAILHTTGDLRDEGSLQHAVRGVDAVCHLAALTRARESIAEPLAYWQTNVTGTLNLLSAMVGESPGRHPLKLVLASTCAVYDFSGGQAVTEQTPERPMTPYAATKLAADNAAAGAAATGMLGAVSIRALNIGGAASGHGDSDPTRLIPRLLRSISDPAYRVRINGDGSAERDLVHVEDMAEAFGLALDACKTGEWSAYNVGSGTTYSIRAIIAAVRELTGRPVRAEHGPAQPEPLVLAADSGRARRVLGWEPTRSNLRRIIADAWAAHCRSAGMSEANIPL